MLGAAQGRGQPPDGPPRSAADCAGPRALALRWSDSDLDAGALTVNRTLHRVTGQGIVFAEPKSEVSRRRIALPTRWSICSGPIARRSLPSGCGRVTGGRTATYQHVLPALGRDAADQMGAALWH